MNKKKLSTLLICILFSRVCYCQMLKGTYQGADGVPHNLEFYDGNAKIIPIGDRSDIYGSPLFKSKFGFGIIQLKNGMPFSDSSLGYSLYNNQLYFNRNGKIYPVIYPVKKFSIEYSEGLDEKKIYNFQNGFPSIYKNDSLTFYEVLFEGNNISLLKRVYEKVLEPFEYGIGGHRGYFLFEEFFVFFPKENKIIEMGIRPGLNVLRKNLPEYANPIKVYNSTHKLNTKKEDDLIQLFSFLNNVNFK